jgi:hypothetical protein
MKALLQAGLGGRVPAPPEKRFLISHFEVQLEGKPINPELVLFREGR